MHIVFFTAVLVLPYLLGQCLFVVLFIAYSVYYVLSLFKANLSLKVYLFNLFTNLNFSKVTSFLSTQLKFLFSILYVGDISICMLSGLNVFNFFFFSWSFFCRLVLILYLAIVLV